MQRVRMAAAGLLLSISLTAAGVHAYQEYDDGHEASQPSDSAAEEHAPTEMIQGEPVLVDPAPQEQASVEPQPAVQAADVLMRALAFFPKELQVSAGTTVTWSNFDPFDHTVTADDGSFDSQLIPSGGTFALTFTGPGVVAYHCIPHGSPGGGGMAATVVVS